MIAIPATVGGVLPALGSRYRSVRAATRKLADRLTPEDQMVQSMAEASPTKWHLAHTTWFYETFILSQYDRSYRAFDCNFTYLFNSYYKQLQGHPARAVRGAFSRPSLEEVRAYRAQVDGAMEALIEKLPTSQAAEILERVELGLNHEQQHQELIVTDIKHAFWMNPLRPALVQGSPDRRHSEVPRLEWPLQFHGGLQEIGAPALGNGFAFDNERPRHEVFIQPFRLAARLVTNREYLEFMEAGGYSKPELWLSDGWDAVIANQWQAPLYWEKRAERDEWQVFTAFGMQPLELAEPVCHVSYYEADAYARWRGWRLPSEAEWEVAARSLAVEGNFAESERFHPAPCGAAESRESGWRQMFGDVWEWTASPYTAYPGYKAPAGVLGEYNGKFMCNQMVLRGGSCATPQSHIRATYRNFFPPAARWQFMGIRPANDCA